MCYEGSEMRMEVRKGFEPVTRNRLTKVDEEERGERGAARLGLQDLFGVNLAAQSG